jgi:hypothetical protein
MASSARIDELKKKFDENPRRYFAPLANEFRKMGDLDQAIMICEEFLPQQPGHMSGHIVYGQALYESGKLPESRVVFETALGLDPENLIALRHLGDISRSQGELADARRWYDRVLEADPRNDEIQGLIASLSAPSPVEAEAAASMGSARPIVLEPAVPALPVMRPASPPPEITPIDLDMDEGIFAVADARVEIPEPARPASPAAGLSAVGETFDSISLEGLAPSTPTPPPPAAPSAAPKLGTSGFELDVPSGRAEGLQSSEFEVPSEPTARAEGLEPAEFEAPTAPPPRAEGLELSPFDAPAPPTPRVSTGSLLELDTDFAGAPDTPVAPLRGLEETAAASPLSGLPDLDADDGSVVPPHGDLLGESAPASTSPNLAHPASVGAPNPVLEPPAAMEAMPALELDAPEPMPSVSRRELDAIDSMPSMSRRESDAADVAAIEAAAVSGLPMMELTPSVIAAEAVLIETGSTLASTDEMLEAEESRSSTAPAPFVTETMAELYLKQGFRDQALAVYRQLSDAAPADARLRARVAELQPEPEAVESGPTVREFFARLAALRPGERAASTVPPSNDDFASFEPVPAPQSRPAAEVERAPTPIPAAPRATPTSVPMSSGTERGATAQGGAPTGGTIDALFGNRSVGTSEDSAASALAQAFSGSIPVVPAISGRPARAASGEISLDSVFRDGSARPPRASQSFSFDQFFSESAAENTATPSTAKPTPVETADQGEPAERGADDIQQFNSWLQGLKQK